ncbi:lytic polysaccharide monooxygenase [Chryseobacterium sp. OSA05B]|uniref:lytic polysaccharide monooxygenase n=1 Tax=Chryseobacterium sp. OSA05B TaxID=2862650 RepID=UPI001CC1BB4B|nr:lytic polysaccharide monooxygenase [Chryseobacterium sp. OSA05B]
MIKNKFLFLVKVIGILMISTSYILAHGYVMSPASRNYQGSLDKGILGYSAAYAKYGTVINEPQSLEYLKGFPLGGPADGKIASANGIMGDTVLDLQTADRWKKTNISTGVNSFMWKYTAYHSTTKWHYYMTKTGWNPNQPLKRADLELIGTVNGNALPPTDNTPHQITVPQNRQGYHIILAVWDIEDTVNAFYNVIDVNVGTSVVNPTAPATPTGLAAHNITGTTAQITWTAQPDAASYIVFKNSQQVQEVSGAVFQDQGLTPNTAYSYKVQAKSASGLTSAQSAALNIQTSAANTIEKPTAPAHLHSMGTTTHSASLMWGPSTHSQGIQHYEIFQHGVKVAQTTTTQYDVTGLSADTQYKFTVKAISQNNISSDPSNELSVKTNQNTETGHIYCGSEVYNASNAYPTANTHVFYQCRIWKNKWYANPNEVPGVNLVWEEVSVCTEGPDCQNTQPVTYCGSQEYNPAKAYATSGTKVFYACKIWENQWYANTGEIPGQNMVWKLVSSCNEGVNCTEAKSAVQDKLSFIVSDNVLNLEPVSSYEKIEEVKIFDIRGTLILSFSKPVKNSMNISSLPSGIYFTGIVYSDKTYMTKTFKK